MHTNCCFVCMVQFVRHALLHYLITSKESSFHHIVILFIVIFYSNIVELSYVWLILARVYDFPIFYSLTFKTLYLQLISFKRFGPISLCLIDTN